MKKLAVGLLMFASSVFQGCNQESIGLKNPASQVVLTKVSVKLQVGEFLYENIEASLLVKGFDIDNNQKWSANFLYSGPNDNAIAIPNNYDHYIISFEKWGVSDNQVISADELFKSRADGESPVTYSLAARASFVKRPVYTVDYAQTSANDFPIQSKTEYTYDNEGKIALIKSYDYSLETSAYIASQYTNFSYTENKLSKLTKFTAADNKIISEDNYLYGVNGNLVQITEKNFNTGSTGVMDLTLDATLTKSKAAYSFSTGSGFDYHFDYALKNIVSERTVVGDELCNQGTFAYDRNINPLKHLGFIAFTFDNYSINNRLTENVVFSGCSYPTLIPESYSYKYDDDGYPTEKTTHYKGRNEVTVTRFHYQIFPQ